MVIDQFFLFIDLCFLDCVLRDLCRFCKFDIHTSNIVSNSFVFFVPSAFLFTGDQSLQFQDLQVEKESNFEASFMSDKISPFCCQSGCLENTILHPEIRTTSSSITLGSRIFKPETPLKIVPRFPCSIYCFSG